MHVPARHGHLAGGTGISPVSVEEEKGKLLLATAIKPVPTPAAKINASTRVSIIPNGSFAKPCS